MSEGEIASANLGQASPFSGFQDLEIGATLNGN
jgi:hypothetical protein